jgi:hypothetical protein
MATRILLLAIAMALPLQYSATFSNSQPKNSPVSSLNDRTTLIADSGGDQRRHEEEIREQESEAKKRRAKDEAERSRNATECHDNDLPARSAPTFWRSL